MHAHHDHHNAATSTPAPLEAAADFLKRLPGAAERLVLFEADLLKPGSYQAAFQGCEVGSGEPLAPPCVARRPMRACYVPDALLYVQCVFHTASPFVNHIKQALVEQQLLQPAVHGTENVLSERQPPRLVAPPSAPTGPVSLPAPPFPPLVRGAQRPPGAVKPRSPPTAAHGPTALADGPTTAAAARARAGAGAASAASSVRRVVLTSSVAAVYCTPERLPDGTWKVSRRGSGWRRACCALRLTAAATPTAAGLCPRARRPSRKPIGTSGPTANASPTP